MITIFIVITSIIYHRSLFANIVEIYLFLTSKRKWHARLPFTFKLYLKDKKKNKDKKYKVCKIKNICPYYEESFENMQVFVFNENSNAKNIILYLHGGAYISFPTKHHIRFVNKLAKKTNSIIVFPIYPKAFSSTYIETFSKVYNLFIKIKEKTSLNITIMGDSSGGGLATSILIHLSIYDNIYPTNAIVLSPWLDLTFSEKNIKKYERKDPMLAIKPIKEIAKIYALSLDNKDYRVSPYYADVSKLKNLTIFVGGKEILYPEIITFYNKCKSSNVNVNLIVKKGLNHVYPLYPIKEGKEALNIICDIINKK